MQIHVYTYTRDGKFVSETPLDIGGGSPTSIQRRVYDRGRELKLPGSVKSYMHVLVMPDVKVPVVLMPESRNED